jgi:hypothetical protein
LENRLQKQKAEKDPVQMLRLLRLADAQAAPPWRKRIFQRLVDVQKNAGKEQLDQLGQQFAQLLPVVISTPAQADELLGEDKQVSRQLLYRHYREQWVYQQPLPLVLTFIYRKGQEPVLLKVQLVRSH